MSEEPTPAEEAKEENPGGEDDTGIANSEIVSETQPTNKASTSSSQDEPEDELMDDISEDLSAFIEEHPGEFEDTKFEDEELTDITTVSIPKISESVTESEEKKEYDEHVEVRSETGLSDISTPTLSGRFDTEEVEYSNRGRATTLTPFSHLWCLGCNIMTGAVACSLKKGPREIAYAASHLGILLNCDTKTIHRLPGHQSIITSMACDAYGKWLLTVDSGPNSCLIIWYRSKRIPVHTKFAQDTAQDEAAFGRVTMSPCGRLYAVMVLTNAPYLIICEWSLPRDTEIVVHLPTGFGVVEKLTFSSSTSSNVIAATSKTSVAFITYNMLDFSVEEAASVSRKLVETVVGYFSDTTFLNVPNRAATSTKMGYLLLWGRGTNGKMILKSYFHLNPDPINVIKYHGGLVAAGDQGGVVHFYDDKFRLRFSTHGLQMGPIVSFDFDHCKLSDEERLQDPNGTNSIAEHDVGDFIVTTEDGRLMLVNLIEKTLKDLIEPIPKKIICMHSCPTRDIMCIVTEDNQLRLYNLGLMELVAVSCLMCPKGDSSPATVTVLKFSSHGTYICCCQEDGAVRTLDAKTLASIDQVAEGDKAIYMIAFSNNSFYIAMVDIDLTLWLYLVSKSRSLTLIGKVRNIHAEKVVSMNFSGEHPDRLITVGADRRIIIHRLEKKKNKAVLETMVKEIDHRIEQFAQPTCVLKHPTLNDHLILVNSAYKYRVLNTKNYTYTKTCLAPTIKHCKPISHMESLCEKDIFFFITGQMAGIQKLPLDGNPYKNISMLLCGSKIEHYGFAFDKFCLLTTGTDDSTIHMWKVKPEMVELVEVLGGVGLQPYYCLLEGGESGDTMKDIKDLFIYIQILHEGHAINYPREVEHTMRACGLVNLFRALGYFPSEYDIKNLYHEIGIKSKADLYKTVIDFETFVKLFINHRPHFGVSKTSLARAFRILCSRGGDPKNHTLTRDEFISFLTEHGDCWRRGEFSTIVMRLAGHGCEERAPNATNVSGGHTTIPGPPEDTSVDDLPGGDDASRASSQTQHKMLQNLYNELLPAELNFEFLYYDLLGMKRSRHKREHLLSGGVSKFSMSRIRKSAKTSTIKKVSFASSKANKMATG